MKFLAELPPSAVFMEWFYVCPKDSLQDVGTSARLDASLNER